MGWKLCGLGKKDLVEKLKEKGDKIKGRGQKRKKVNFVFKFFYEALSLSIYNCCLKGH